MTIGQLSPMHDLYENTSRDFQLGATPTVPIVVLSALRLQMVGDKHQGSTFLLPLNRVTESDRLVARHMHPTIGVIFWFLSASDTGCFFDD
jgi:hypothetical protein